MAQKLSVKTRTAAGEFTKVGVEVLRSWQDAGGAAIYLHKNGVFGYKDGAPVRDMSELDLLASDERAYNAAVQWWKTSGAKLSEEYYTAQDDAHARLALRKMGGGGAGVGDNTGLDMVRYIRRPIKNRSRAAYCEPSAWSEFFDKRPDWWGAANVIEIADFRYQIVAIDDEVVDPESDDSGSKTSDPGSETPDGDL